MPVSEAAALSAPPAGARRPAARHRPPACRRRWRCRRAPPWWRRPRRRRAAARRRRDPAARPGTKIGQPEHGDGRQDGRGRLRQRDLAASGRISVPNSVEPMPTTMASTISLMPEEMTLPSTRSARNAVCAEQRERHQHEAGQRRQLELDDGDEQLDGEHEEGQQHDQPGQHQHDDGHEVGEERS